MLILKNCETFAPDLLGKQDILIAQSKIEAISAKIPVIKGLEVEVIDCAGLKAVPGFIDGHVHFAGAGGEGGPASRTPELMLGDFIEAGVTTAIGMLGTDGYTRTVANLIQKARALSSEGISTFALTGSYQVPPPTLTGDIVQDIILIPEIIGAGEIAVSDHRSSAPTIHELARLAKAVRLAGLLSGKTGVICLHMGDAPKTFDPVLDVIAMAGISHRHFLPTHCNRSQDVFERAVSFGRRGGYIDITTSAYPFYSNEEVKPSTAVMKMVSRGVAANRICMSSDAGGSLPDFDKDGNLKGSQVGKLKSMHSEFVDLVRSEGFSIDAALPFLTSNVAAIYGLSTKGKLLPGFDADILLLDETLSIKHILAKGVFQMKNGERMAFGHFEKRA